MAGYTRTDTTNNIADGNIINAADLDNEFDGIQAAFNSSTGHNHDGTTGEGAPILVLGPSQDVVVGSTTVTPKLTNTVDIGSSSLKFKDLYLAGTLNVTTIDTTNLEVTNIKAKDGTASITIADSTGAVSFANNVTLGDATTDTVTVNGYMGVGGVGTAGAGIYVGSTALSGTSQVGVISTPVGTSGSTSVIASFRSTPASAAASFTSANVIGLWAQDVTKGAGSTITNQHGVYIVDQTQGTNNYGITSLVSSGTDKWNIYASGTASNYFGGNIGLGVAPSAWGSSYDVFEVRNAGNALWSSAANDMKLTTNVVHNGTNYTYAATAVAARYDQNTGQHIWYNAASGTAGDTISWTQAMTLNASGNLGLGVTPSAWGSGYNAFDVGNGYGLARLSTDGGILLTNAYFNGTNYIYKNSAFAAGYEQNDSIHKWFTAASGTAGATITFTQAMTLDASGRLLIGTTSSRTNNLSSASFLQLEAVNSSATGALVRNSADTSGAGLILGKSRGTSVGSVTAVASGDRLGTLSFSGTDGTSMLSAATIISEVDGTPGTNDMPGRLVFSTTADGASSPTERMRIDSSGNVGIGNDSPTVKLDVAGSTQSTWSATSTSISGTTMTIAGTVTGTIAIGDLVYGTGVQPYTRIVSGSATTWIVSVSQTVASATLVGGAVYSNTLIRISNTDTSEAAAQPTGGLQFYTSDASAPTAGVGAYVAALAETTTPDTALVFGTRDNGGGGVDANERMRIDSSGNVGIGTSSPTSYSSKFIEVSNATSAGLKLTAGTSGLSLGADFSYIASDKSLRITTYESTGFIRFNTQDTERMRIDSSGNLGLGVTPSAWTSIDKAFEIGRAGNGLFSGGVDDVTVNSNAYYASGWKYGSTGFANRFNIGSGNGSFQWFTAASGTAGNAISFTQAMTLDASGNLGVGTTSTGSAKLTVRSGTGTAHTILGNDYGSLYLETASGGPNRITSLNAALNTSQALAFNGAGGAEWGRFDSSGNMGIGTSSPGTKLDVSGNLRLSASNPAIELNNGGAQVYSTSANTLQFATGGGIGSATERMRIDSNGTVTLVSTSGLSIGRTAVTSPASTDGNVFSGSYTPSQVSTNTNVAAVTYSACQYMRVGSVVTVSGQVEIDPTTAATNTIVLMSLPIASNFSAARQLGGAGLSTSVVNYASQAAMFFANSTNDCVEIRLNPASASAVTYAFSFTYQVI